MKTLAAEDLQREKQEARREQRLTLQTRALEVWTHRLGEEADPPLEENLAGYAPKEVGGIEIEWTTGETSAEMADQAAALAVVLEAYSVLSSLDARDRARLIHDILSIFESAT